MSMISPSSRLPCRTIVVLGAAITALCAGGAGVTARAHKTAASHERGFSTADHAVTPDLAASAQVRERYGHLPLSFEANHGQSDSTVKFLSRGSGYSLFLTSNEAVLVLKQSEADENRKASRVARAAVSVSHRKSAVVRMTLVNANSHSQPAGHDALPGKSNYFIGNNPAKWHTNIPTYAKVKYEGVYPGVDLVYYGNQGRLEYDFVVAPGADPRLVTLAFEGAREIHIDARGELVLGVEGGEVRQHKPVVYQEVAGVKQEVAGRYVMKGTRQVGFRVAAYDRSRPLIIDPVLVYSTYLGGNSFETGQGIAVDGAGSVYVTGNAASTNFPTTAGAAQTTHAGGFDAFVTKLDAAGSALVYSTYLGGNGFEAGRGIAVDGAGSGYVTGNTLSNNFPTTAGAFQTTPAGVSDAFVIKLDATGSGLVYSTYLGGSALDIGHGIVVDGAGSAYVTGQTVSTNFPTTAGAAQTTPAGDYDAFVAKIEFVGPLPTSTDQCKKGGWKTFGVFKNEGDCVSFVASKGRKPPSGP
jgi:Beta-propeller repeat